MMKIQRHEVDFDPPPPPATRFDIRHHDEDETSSSISDGSGKEGDRVYASSRRGDLRHSDLSSRGVEDYIFGEEEGAEENQQEGDWDNISMEWSNGPAIPPSPNQHQKYHYETTPPGEYTGNKIVELELHQMETYNKNNKSKISSNKSIGSNQSPVTVYEDDNDDDDVVDEQDENKGVFLGWPTHEASPPSQQQQHHQQQQGRNQTQQKQDDESVTLSEERSWWKWKRRSTEDGMIINLRAVSSTSYSSNPSAAATTGGGGGGENCNSITDNRCGQSADENQQWWQQFGNGRIRRGSTAASVTTTSSVDDEFNEWLFPRRGRSNQQSNIMVNTSRRRSLVTSGGALSSTSSSSSAALTSGDNRSRPPQSQDEHNGVESIVEKLTKNLLIDVSPIERALLNDMASTKNHDRWCKSGFNLNDDAKYNGIATTPTSAEQGDDIYWDSDKLLKMKREVAGVSLSRARALDDDVSSIASSDHSGRLPLMKNIAHKRSSFTSRSSFTFGWNSNKNSTSEEGSTTVIDGDNCSFKVEKIIPRSASGGRLSSMASSIRPKSTVSTQSNVPLSKIVSRRRSSIDYDDYDESSWTPLAEEDYKHETVVKEACEIMASVNNSVVAMGMNAPFRRMEEICPPFQKLHKNLGHQMDALKAAIYRRPSQPTRQQGSKKSKRLRASKLKDSFSSMSSSGSSSFISSNLNTLNDYGTISKFLIAQMAMMQSQQNGDSGSLSISSNVTQQSFYTSWLPNYLWYQPNAADSTSVMRPTSLCSGTGITGDEQYLNPEMLKVFQMFSTYFVGSKHLFQEVDEGNNENCAKMRRSYWMETIDEEIDSDGEMSEVSSCSVSNVSDESDVVYELDNSGADINHFIDAERQIEILQSVIEDLRKNQMNGTHQLMSIQAHSPQQS
jgi:hypothetical protein